jgi:hypothetical protein
MAGEQVLHRGEELAFSLARGAGSVQREWRASVAASASSWARASLVADSRARSRAVSAHARALASEISKVGASRNTERVRQAALALR